jgi:hypothetical protein
MPIACIWNRSNGPFLAGVGPGWSEGIPLGDGAVVERHADRGGRRALAEISGVEDESGE